jgi:hypothetical protein
MIDFFYKEPFLNIGEKGFYDNPIEVRGCFDSATVYCYMTDQMIEVFVQVRVGSTILRLFCLPSL